MVIGLAFEHSVHSEVNAYISYTNQSFYMLCGLIGDFRIALTVVLTICSSWIQILPRAYGLGPIHAETRPRMLGFTQHRHVINYHKICHLSPIGAQKYIPHLVAVP